MGVSPIDQHLRHELMRAARFGAVSSQSVPRPIGEVRVDPGGSIKHVHIRRIVREQDSNHLDGSVKVANLIINLRQFEAGLSVEWPVRKMGQGSCNRR